MNRKYSIIFAFLLTLLFATNYLFYNQIKKSSSLEEVFVTNVIDGDTFELDDGRKVRLANINSPEKKEKNSELALNYLKKLENKSISIEVIGNDIYNRYLARAYHSEDYINLKLVELGYSAKFLVDSTELTNFAIAEKKAIEKNKGIWIKSEYYGCIYAELNPIEEMIFLSNTCDFNSILILKDESTKKFLIQSDFKLLTIHSSSGESNSTDLFLNSENIWNNDRDTLYLFDKDRNLVLSTSYGYL